MKKRVIIGTFILALLVGCSNADDNKESKNSPAVAEVKQVLQNNYTYSQEEDMEGYLNTIVKSGREDTRHELKGFFENYDINYELLSFEVLEEEADRIVVEAEQRAKATFIAEDQSYHDHIATSEYTFVKEDGEWRISESELTNTELIN